MWGLKAMKEIFVFGAGASVASAGIPFPPPSRGNNRRSAKKLMKKIIFFRARPSLDFCKVILQAFLLIVDPVPFLPTKAVG